jgi:hypothetical protein
MAMKKPVTLYLPGIVFGDGYDNAYMIDPGTRLEKLLCLEVFVYGIALPVEKHSPGFDEVSAGDGILNQDEFISFMIPLRQVPGVPPGRNIRRRILWASLLHGVENSVKYSGAVGQGLNVVEQHGVFQRSGDLADRDREVDLLRVARYDILFQSRQVLGGIHERGLRLGDGICFLLFRSGGLRLILSCAPYKHGK